jgi:hypothetical protein
MSRGRHKKAEGGKVFYAGGSSETAKEAEEKKKGGKVDGGKHEAARHRMDRPGRKRGGRAGAERAPLSMASKITDAGAHKTTDDGDAVDD